MKQLKRLLRKKGFTISEVLVAMMIFAIMTAIVMQILAIAINQHKNNVNSEKDMDKQVQDIVEYNSNMVKRETADMAINFVRTGSNKVASIDITGADIMRNNAAEASGDGRLELNTHKGEYRPRTQQATMTTKITQVWYPSMTIFTVQRALQA